MESPLSSLDDSNYSWNDWLDYFPTPREKKRSMARDGRLTRSGP